MIDTIKFKIPVDLKLHEKIAKKSVELLKYDHLSDRAMFKIFNKKINIGSYDRNINIFLYDEEYCSIEFSIPKLFYGHNVYMFYPEKINELVDELYKELIKIFDTFTNPIHWLITRLDLCYAWKLPNEEVANSVLQSLKGIEVSRMRRHIYDTTVMWNNGGSSIKFYLKHPEYYSHDFLELKKRNLLDIAYSFFDISEGVLRFEVTLRNNALARCFYGPTDVHCISLDPEIFNSQTLAQKLNKYMYKVLRLKNIEATDYKKIYNKLYNCYGTQQARHLFIFYKLLFSSDPQEKEILKTYSRYQVWRNSRKLQEANIGITTEILSQHFDLNIPSSYCINNQPDAVATG